jgi:hypothetical protein
MMPLVFVHDSYNAHSASFVKAVQDRQLIDHGRRQRLTDCGPNLRCQRKSPFGITQLRFAPIIRIANIDGIRIQFDKIFRP